MKIASIAFTENGAKVVKMLVREMDVKGYVFEKYKTDGLETFNHVSSLVSGFYEDRGFLLRALESRRVLPPPLSPESPAR